jgi:hypothetical protein
MKLVLTRRTRIAVMAAALIFVSLAAIGVQYVVAPPPSSNAPVPISQYGVARTSVRGTFQGITKIRILSDGAGPFFIVKILIILNKPADADIVLDSLEIDGTGSIPVSGYSAASKVVIVSAGAVVGELIASIPSYLAFLLVKEPLGNVGIAANGGDLNGFTFVLRFLSGAYYLGTTITAIALVTAPANSTVTMTMTQ